MNVTVNQCGFGTDIPAGGAATNNPGTTITNPPPFSLGITNSSSAQVDYSVTNNTFWGADGNKGAIYAVTISGASTTATSYLNGSFNNNKIGKAGVTSSGGANGVAALGLLPGTGGHFHATVIGNDIRQVNSIGINFFNSAGANAATDGTLKCKGNTFAEPDTTGAPALQRAIVVSPGNSGGGVVNPWIAEIGDTTGTVPANKNNISGAWQVGAFIRVTNNNNTVALTLPGLSPASGATAAQVNTFVEGANTFGAPATGTDVNTAIGTSGINGGAPLPLLFAQGGIERSAWAMEKSLLQCQLDASVAAARARWEAAGQLITSSETTEVNTAEPSAVPEGWVAVFAEVPGNMWKVDAKKDQRIKTGDRLAIIDEQGNYLGEEYTLALCLSQVLALQAGPVVTNCATSRMSQDLAAQFGTSCSLSAVGEANVVDEMLRTKALFGGPMTVARVDNDAV